MHTPAGHTNHFWTEVSKALRPRMKNCHWQVRLRLIDFEVEAKLREVEAKVKELRNGDVVKEIKSRLRRVRKELKDCAVD